MPHVPAGVAEQVSRLLAEGQDVSDDLFDQLLTDRPRQKSRTYWTPVEGAKLASAWLTEVKAERVLDVGSGPGKFAVIVSLLTKRRVFGIERRDELVFQSRQLARRLGADVQIAEGTLEAVKPEQYDAFYFYNPFGELLSADADRYDTSFPGSFDAYLRSARLVERWLRGAPVGTVMVTYNGLGGRIPTTYSLKRQAKVRQDVMRLWVKERAHDDGDAVLEVEGELVTARHMLELAKTSGADFSDSPLVAALCEPGE